MSAMIPKQAVEPITGAEAERTGIGLEGRQGSGQGLLLPPPGGSQDDALAPLIYWFHHTHTDGLL